MEEDGILPRTYEVNSQGKDPSTFEGRGHKAERWRVQKKRKEEKWRKKKKKKEKEKGEVQKKETVGKAQRDHRKSVCGENEDRGKTSQSKTNLREHLGSGSFSS